MKRAFLVTFLLVGSILSARGGDSLRKAGDDRFSALVYGRVISNNRSVFRYDESVLAAMRLNRLFRFEGGFRIGERQSLFGAYYQYKLELQTRYLMDVFRFTIRYSDDVFVLPSPFFRKMSGMATADFRIRIWGPWRIQCSVGSAYSRRYNDSQVEKTKIDDYAFYPVYRLYLRYQYTKGYAEAGFGSYDIFNPLDYHNTFIQATIQYAIVNQTSIYFFARYQFDNSDYSPVQYLAGLGLRVVKF